MSRGFAGILAVTILLLPAAGALQSPAAAAPREDAKLVPFTREQMEALVESPALASPPVPDPDSGSLSPIALPLGLLQNDCGAMRDAPASRAEAVPLASSVDCLGTVAWADTADAYRFEATRGDVLDVTLTFYDGYSLQACLTTPSGEPSRCAYGVGPAGRLHWTAAESGTWFLDVVRTRGGTGGGDYRLQMAARTPVTDDDCGAGADAGNSTADAVAFALPGACVGEVNSLLDAADWLAVTLTRGQAFHVTVESSGVPSACVRDAAGATLDCAQDVYPPQFGEVRTSELYFEAPVDGAYHVSVHAGGPPASGPYRVTFTPAARQDDCGTGADASRYAVPDAPLAPPASCSGVIAYAVGDDLDAFLFDAPAALRVTLDVPARATLCLLNPTGDFGACAFSWQAGETLSFPYQAAEGGRWELWVWVPFASRANFTYALTVEPFTPTPQDDCGTGRDAADDMTHHPHVASIDCGGVLLGTEGDYADLYSFNTTEAGNVTVTATGTPGKRLHVCMTDGRSWWHCAEGDGAVAVTRPTDGPAHWHVDVSSYEETDGAYTLALDVAPA